MVCRASSCDDLRWQDGQESFAVGKTGEHVSPSLPKQVDLVGGSGIVNDAQKQSLCLGGESNAASSAR